MSYLNQRLTELQPYPFTRLAELLKPLQPAKKPCLKLTIGEPQHTLPGFVQQVTQDNLQGLSHYPLTKGTEELRITIAAWASKRFSIPEGLLDPSTMVLPVNGTREALFAFAQVVLDAESNQLVCMPNPFYQIYEGAALLAGATPYFINCTDETGYQTDFSQVPTSVWEQCGLLYLCSPGNPTGAVLSSEQLQYVIRLSDEFNFVIASDECYSEIYHDELNPPAGLLQACAEMGRNDFANCVVFHSLSKRSNLPGLRSGFVAGDASLLKAFLQYRTYHGSAMSELSQAISVAAWQDESHVRDNRALYREKYDAVLPILSEVLEMSMPDAGFYLWPKTPVDDKKFTGELYEQENVLVTPGSFLTRPTSEGNPGTQRIRLALVTPLEECVQAAERIAEFTQRNYL